MGEAFNGDDNYVGDYQKYVSALFNYPMYFTIKDVWMYGKTMWNIHNRWDSNKAHFQDVSLLGLFVDNHDNARFLNGKNDQTLFKSALTFALTANGIPFFYYGSEQGFAGGSDPGNREPIWNNFNKDHDIYKFVQTINKARAA